MFELKEIKQQIEDNRKLFSWLITGLGIHGLKISDAKYINWGWVIENYNIEEFDCFHLRVQDIGYVICCGDIGEPTLVKCWKGVCKSCGRLVYGKTTQELEVIYSWNLKQK